MRYIPLFLGVEKLVAMEIEFSIDKLGYFHINDVSPIYEVLLEEIFSRWEIKLFPLE